MSLVLARRLTIFALLVPVALTACGGDDGNASTTTQTATALESAQCTFKKGRTTENACFSTYITCNAATGADPALCRAALQDCLPKPPAVTGTTASTSSDRKGGRGDGDHSGRGRDGDHDGRGGGASRPTPDPTAVATCRTGLDSCLASLKGDQTPCFTAHNKCVDEAFRAAFQKSCDDNATRCATVDAEDTEKVAACDALKKRCAEGVGGRFGKDAVPCP